MIGSYGHGTHNDFVILFDPQNEHELNTEQIARICNRQTGIGADGFIRIIKRENKWFMDYRNQDGSIAEMCGNGIRVMARYLIERGHQPEGIFAINTRAGMKYLAVPADDDISVNMGHVEEVYDDVTVRIGEQSWPALHISVGNPHAVVFVTDLAEIGDLATAPEVDGDYPDGVNVEFVQFLDNGELAMRVHERGVGETQSCGTGTCAVALAATLKKGGKLPSRWVINPPGGRLVVDIDGHNNATLIGPAVIVKDVELDAYL
jgi:diaminopimelate epimerase